MKRFHNSARGYLSGPCFFSATLNRRTKLVETSCRTYPIVMHYAIVAEILES